MERNRVRKHALKTLFSLRKSENAQINNKDYCKNWTEPVPIRFFCRDENEEPIAVTETKNTKIHEVLQR